MTLFKRITSFLLVVVIIISAINLHMPLTVYAETDVETSMEPLFISAQGSTRYICSEENNLITNYDFEESGNWNTETFICGGLSVSDYSDTISGNKVLKLVPTQVTGGIYNTFYVDVEPQTDYSFSAWVKGETRSNTNKTDMTFGITDAETGKFLASKSGNNTDRRFTEDLQLCAPSWDGEWHLVGLTFNSGDDSKIGVTIFSESSNAYFDDMYLCKLSNAEKYISSATNIKNATVKEGEPAVYTCEKEYNLIENYDFSNSASNFWQTGLEYGKNVKITDESYTVGNALLYTQSKSPEHKYYIKYVDVKPNTNYTFSTEYCVLSGGNGAFGIIDGSEYLPKDIIRYTFLEDNLNNFERIGINFNSGGHTRIGFFVYDGGGQALLDNIYLFEQIKVNTQIVNGGFEEGTTGWYWSSGVSSNYYHTGKQSLIINDGTGDYKVGFQCIYLTPNTDYEYSFWYYAPSGGSGDNSSWYINGAPNGIDRANPVGYLKKVNSTLKSGTYSTCYFGMWKHVSGEFNSGEYSIAVFSFAAHKTAVYIDDVFIEEKGSSTVEDYSRELVTPLGKAQKTDAPKVLSYTQNSIELVADDNLEYCIGGGNWQSSPVFENLSIGKEYVFYSRVAGNDVFTEGESSEPLVFTIPASAGDANADNSVNSRDLGVLKKLLIGAKTEYDPDGCDSNDDTVINLLDLVSIKKRAAGIRTETAPKVSKQEREKAENSGVKQPIANEYERLGFDNEYDYLLARDGFIYGMDYDWFPSNVTGSHHLSNNNILNQECVFNDYSVELDIYNIASMGYRAVNLWLLTSGQGLIFDENGTVIGLEQKFLDNIEKFLNICRKYDISCVPSILPHGIADNYGNGSGTETATEIWNKYFRFYYNDEARKAYIENAVEPLCKLFAEFTDVIPICNLTIENTNYVDDPTKGYLMSGTVGTTWENISKLINDMDSCVKKYMPNMMTSTENMGDSFLQFRCNELNVDLIGQNCYSSGNVKDPATEYITKPSYLGEFNEGSLKDESWNADSVRLNFYPNALNSGYKGGFYFSYSTGGDIFTLFKGLPTEYESLHPFALTLSYKVDEMIKSHRGVNDSLYVPRLLYNTGSNEVYWLPGATAVKFKIECSLDGGITWKNVVTDLNIENCILENGLCKYVDETVSEGMNYCYRVTSYDRSGNMAVSKPNNSADYYEIKELIIDGGFENGKSIPNFKLESGWYGTGFGNVSNKDAHSGLYSLVGDKANGLGSGAWGATYQTVKVMPNTTYTLSYWIKSYKGKCFVQVWDKASNSAISGAVAWHSGTYTEGDEEPEWKNCNFVFTTGDYDTIEIAVKYNNSEDGKFYFDDFSLKENR